MPLSDEIGRVTPPPSKASFGLLPGWVELSSIRPEFDVTACLIKKLESDLGAMRHKAVALIKKHVSEISELKRQFFAVNYKLQREASAKAWMLEKQESELEELKREVARLRACLCPICFEQPVNSRLPCGHAFCDACLNMQEHQKCSLCRRPFNLDYVLREGRIFLG